MCILVFNKNWCYSVLLQHNLSELCVGKLYRGQHCLVPLLPQSCSWILRFDPELCACFLHAHMGFFWVLWFPPSAMRWTVWNKLPLKWTNVPSRVYSCLASSVPRIGFRSTWMNAYIPVYIYLYATFNIQSFFFYSLIMVDFHCSWLCFVWPQG